MLALVVYFGVLRPGSVISSIYCTVVDLVYLDYSVVTLLSRRWCSPIL